MKKLICITDYGCGNTTSIRNSIEFLGYKVLVSNKISDIKRCTHLILPGVGSYSNAISKVKNNLNLKIINSEINFKRKPILGICVGMQIMSDYGLEFQKSNGLKWINGKVLKMSDRPNIIPQIGWNNLKIIEKRNKLFDDIDEKDFFYFVHSYKFCLKKQERSFSVY